MDRRHTISNDAGGEQCLPMADPRVDIWYRYNSLIEIDAKEGEQCTNACVENGECKYLIGSDWLPAEWDDEKVTLNDVYLGTVDCSETRKRAQQFAKICKGAAEISTKCIMWLINRGYKPNAILSTRWIFETAIALEADAHKLCSVIARVLGFRCEIIDLEAGAGDITDGDDEEMMPWAKGYWRAGPAANGIMRLLTGDSDAGLTWGFREKNTTDRVITGLKWDELMRITLQTGEVHVSDLFYKCEAVRHAIEIQKDIEICIYNGHVDVQVGTDFWHCKDILPVPTHTTIKVALTRPDVVQVHHNSFTIQCKTRKGSVDVYQDFMNSLEVDGTVDTNIKRTGYRPATESDPLWFMSTGGASSLCTDSFVREKRRGVANPKAAQITLTEEFPNYPYYAVAPRQAALMQSIMTASHTAAQGQITLKDNGQMVLWSPTAVHGLAAVITAFAGGVKSYVADTQIGLHPMFRRALNMQPVGATAPLIVRRQQTKLTTADFTLLKNPNTGAIESLNYAGQVFNVNNDALFLDYTGEYGVLNGAYIARGGTPWTPFPYHPLPDHAHIVLHALWSSSFQGLVAKWRPLEATGELSGLLARWIQWPVATFSEYRSPDSYWTALCANMGIEEAYNTFVDKLPDKLAAAMKVGRRSCIACGTHETGITIIDAKHERLSCNTVCMVCGDDTGMYYPIADNGIIAFKNPGAIPTWIKCGTNIYELAAIVTEHRVVWPTSRYRREYRLLEKVQGAPLKYTEIVQPPSNKDSLVLYGSTSKTLPWVADEEIKSKQTVVWFDAAEAILSSAPCLERGQNDAVVGDPPCRVSVLANAINIEHI